jgi:hypothetical protein
MTASAAEVAVDAPSECEGSENVRDQIERLIGKPLAAARSADFAIKVVRSGGNEWNATVQVTPRGGIEGPRARNITGQSCAEVTAAAAVSIAIAIEQDLGAGDAAAIPDPGPRDVAPSESQTTPPADAPGTPVRQSPARKAPSSRSKIRTAAALHGLVDAGALPNPSPCVCTETLCTWNGRSYALSFDAALGDGGETLVGTLVATLPGTAGSVTVRLERQ